jgi:Flp pilus assembly pilin Flp
MACHGWINRLRSRWSREHAQTMAEYGVILGVVTPVIIAAYVLFADSIAAAYDRVTAFF